MEAYTWCLVLLLCVVAVVGIPGNILVMAIYHRKARRLSMNVYISGLAAADLFICGLTAYRLYFWINETNFHDATICQLFTWLGFWSEMLTAFLTTAIALDRYLSVCKPHAAIITPGRAMISIVVFTFSSGLLSLVSFIIYGVSDSMCEIVEEGPLLYVFTTFTFSAFAVLMVLALVFYWLVFREVRRRTKVEPRLIEVRPRHESSSPRPEVTTTTSRSRSAPCSPKRSTEKVSRWEQPQRLVIAKQLEQRLTLVSLAAAYPPGMVRSQSRLDVETVSIHQRAFLTTDIQSWGTRMRSGSDMGPASPVEPTSTSCIGQLGSQIALSPAAKDNAGAAANNQPANRRRRTGKMLLLATIVFVVTWTARCIMWLVNSAAKDWWNEVRQDNDFGFAVLIILQHLYYTTPAVNPIIYSYVNPRFREDCAREIKRLKCRDKPL